MKILSVGGGSGGHVTPVVAVLGELKEQHPRASVRFLCDRHFAPQARSIFNEFDSSIRVSTVWSGKFRRYSHLTVLQHLIIPSIVFPNIRDVFLVIIGTIQSFIRLILWQPDVVFAKGGYVSLPVGLAAWLLRIPVVIHDSDAHPGLTNRLLAPLASKIATGMPLGYYNYPQSKTKYVGIPIDSSYIKLSEAQRKNVKRELGFSPDRPLVVCVGGGQGSRQLNQAVAAHLPLLLPRMNVVLVSGAGQYDEMVSLTPQDDSRFELRDFVSHGMPELLGAADVVVSRAGATFLLELAALARPTIIVPSKRLKWQVKHAQYYIDSGAVLPLDEDGFTNPGDTSLYDAIVRILDDKHLGDQLSDNLHSHARPQAARDVASMIINTAKK